MASRLASRLALTIVPQRGKGLNVINPKWRSLRKRKVIVPELYDFLEMKRISRLPLWENRREMKELGHSPPRSFGDRPIDISSSGVIFSDYVPEAEFKLSRDNILSTGRRNVAYYRALSRIRKTEGLDTGTFGKTAEDIYVQAHEALCRRWDDRLRELATEKAFSEMQWGMKHMTVVWALRRALDPPRVVNIVVKPGVVQENEYGQITVRMRTEQLVAVYDRFGRLVFGDRAQPREVLEFVVFEKHLNGHYPVWRVHGKIPRVTIDRSSLDPRTG